MNKLTAQEAIGLLDNLDGMIEDNHNSDYDSAFKMAIKALEKQIPKKPDLEGDGYWDGQIVYDTWICPCCGKHYEVDYEEYDCCPNCGQRIDWSEQDEQE